MLDSAAIDRIVQNVLKQISPSPVAAPVKAVAAVPSPAISGAKAAPAKPVPASVPTSASASVAIHDRVITGDLLAEKVKGQKLPLVIGAKSLLTPTAHDYIRIHRLEVTRATAGASGAGGEKSGTAATARWKLAIVRTSPALEKLFGELGGAWSRDLLGCPDDAASLAITELSRGAVDGVVIAATQSYRAACRANRHEKVRAAYITEPAGVRAARDQMRLNTIVIDPTAKTYFELRNIIAAFTAPWPESKK